MLHTKENGVLKIAADTYRLTFASDRPFVYLDDGNGKRLAELFVLSSVHPLHGREDTLKIGSWEVEESPEENIFSLAAESTAWRRKIYRFRCLPHRFVYEIEVEGSGQLCEVNYFGGYYSGQLRWGSGYFRSGQYFTRGFNPGPNTAELNYFMPAEGSQIEIMGVPLPGKSDWFFTPPPFFFGFESQAGWLGMGVECQAGGYRFSEYTYHGQHACFHLSLSFEGHTQVSGRYRLPAIGFDFAPDEFEALAAHTQALQSAGEIIQAGGLPPAGEEKPKWWYEPIFCGWGAQCFLAALEKGQAPNYACQSHYEDFLQALDDQGVVPGIVVLDDKWQATYGDNRPDENKWPDLNGFIARQHAAGKKVLLWLKAWDAEGVPPDECITNASGMPLAVDPTNPFFEVRLRESIRILLSIEGYDADGFKIDFTARIPSGPAICTYGDAWGLELMKLYLSIIYDEAKKTKQDALIMTHTPHPYLAGVLDMIRLNDLNIGKDINQAMKLRAGVAATACPNAIIDTDNWPITNKAVWREYLQLQPELGVPSLYYATHIDSTREPLDAEDYRLVRDVWARYRSRMGSTCVPVTGAMDCKDRIELSSLARCIYRSWKSIFTSPNLRAQGMK